MLLTSLFFLGETFVFNIWYFDWSSIFYPNLLSWTSFFPMLLTSLFFLGETFVFNIWYFDWSSIFITLFLGLLTTFVSPSVGTFLFRPISTLLTIFGGTFRVCIRGTFLSQLCFASPFKLSLAFLRSSLIF